MITRRDLCRTMVLASGVVLTAPMSLLSSPQMTLSIDDCCVWACWLGHSTVLLNMVGTIILTDPVLFNNYGLSVLGMTLGPRRIAPPALRVEEIPKPHLVLLSHAHLDHMDRQTLGEISNRWPGEIDVLTASNTRDVIEDFTWRSLNEMDWGDRACIGVVFGGDTAYTKAFANLPGQIDIAIMPIGAYDPYPETHCTPEESLAMVEMMRARAFIPVHHSTFCQSSEPMAEPMQRLRTAISTSSTKLAVSTLGGSYSIHRT